MVRMVSVSFSVSIQSSSKMTRWNLAACASQQILTIMLTVSTGYLPKGRKRGGRAYEGHHINCSLHFVASYVIPLTVSPESITQSALSRTALATSLASARVGRGLVTMLSNICHQQEMGSTSNSSLSPSPSLSLFASLLWLQ